ncbi:MAG: DUF6268 family outer membrane beta-barrel protein [Cyclobacteriaceae bacterium]|jgi:hypothetical protein|nr:DUF6268 family outer membrane beta-barrel protein [Cyclobacteriaceae bacterium]
MRIWLSIFVFAFALGAQGQEGDTAVVAEDFSMYADAELAGDAKRFCTSKVFDQSPNKLISLGYDFQGGHDLLIGVAEPLRVQAVHGIRLGSNFPVISKTNLLLNVGINYWEANYQIEKAENHPLARSLQNRGLRTTGVTATVFKPFNDKNFIFAQSVFDLNGDYYLPDFQSLTYTRVSGTVIYGWKKHDRLLYGFGVSRTYRIGEANYIPVFMYNYTAPSRKWGVESVFPARANLRRTFNARTLAFFGYELEGQTYRLSSLRGFDNIMNPELRRSELRIRFTFERSLKDFIWVSAQAGLRYNWSFNVDDGDFFRGFGNQPYALENDLSNALFFNVSVNLVSP